MGVVILGRGVFRTHSLPFLFYILSKVVTSCPSPSLFPSCCACLLLLFLLLNHAHHHSLFLLASPALTPAPTPTLLIL